MSLLALLNHVTNHTTMATNRFRFTRNLLGILSIDRRLLGSKAELSPNGED
jgi:hypothetical protein